VERKLPRQKMGGSSCRAGLGPGREPLLTEALIDFSGARPHTGMSFHARGRHSRARKIGPRRVVEMQVTAAGVIEPLTALR